MNTTCHVLLVIVGFNISKGDNENILKHYRSLYYYYQYLLWNAIQNEGEIVILYIRRTQRAVRVLEN